MSLNVLVAHSLIDIYAKCIHAEFIWHIHAQVHLDYGGESTDVP